MSHVRLFCSILRLHRDVLDKGLVQQEPDQDFNLMTTAVSLNLALTTVVGSKKHRRLVPHQKFGAENPCIAWFILLNLGNGI